MSNPTGKGGFGDNPNHINRLGRKPAYSLDEIRALGREVANEDLEDPTTQKKIRRIKVMLRRLANSPNPAAVRLFFEYVYGKVPDALEISGREGQPVIIKVGIDPDKI